MSFPRSRIVARLLRVLLSDTNSAYYQIVKSSYRGNPYLQQPFCYWRFLPTAQCLLERTWASFMTTKMASALNQTPRHFSNQVEECLLERTWASFMTTKMASALNHTPRHFSNQVEETSKASGHNPLKAAKVIFVLGGPGSGKGTQCALIVEHFGFTHLSAGDLLRAEIKSGSENGVMIQSMIKEGKIVPSEVTVKLLQKAMLSSSNDKFLIDGFPRNDENRSAFELVTGIRPEFILFFDCSEKIMAKRLLGRNQGRVDDNIETIRKRFKVFVDSSLPVVRHYDAFGKVRKIDADRTKEEVFESVRPLFATFAKKDN